MFTFKFTMFFVQSHSFVLLVNNKLLQFLLKSLEDKIVGFCVLKQKSSIASLNYTIIFEVF